MLEDFALVAFVGSRDLEASNQFYGGLLGLPLIESSEFANAYAARGAQLRVTRVSEVAPARYTVLGWQVKDIVASIQTLSQAGVAFRHYDELTQDGLGVWTAPGGARVAWFADPDGNVLSLQQAPTS